MENVQRIYDHAEEHREELNLYIVGEGGDEDEKRAGDGRETSAEEALVKVAYWPGCVSRGFTPELHGSMALVAERLGIELVELDRANCCGAGVIAEHNQELADTLNARTFAMAQKTGLAMMNICSTCQGAQSECQERLDADAAYRDHINEVLAAEGLDYEARHHQQELPLAARRGLRARPARELREATADRAARRPVLRLLRAAPDHAARLRGAPERDLYLEQRDRGARAASAVDYDGARKCCGFPVITMNRETSLQPGRPPHRRRDRRRAPTRSSPRARCAT